MIKALSGRRINQLDEIGKGGLGNSFIFAGNGHFKCLDTGSDLTAYTPIVNTTLQTLFMPFSGILRIGQL